MPPQKDHDGASDDNLGMMAAAMFAHMDEAPSGSVLVDQPRAAHVRTIDPARSAARPLLRT